MSENPFLKFFKNVKKRHLTRKIPICSWIMLRYSWSSGFGSKQSRAIFCTTQNTIWTLIDWFRAVWKLCDLSFFSCFSKVITGDLRLWNLHHFRHFVSVYWAVFDTFSTKNQNFPSILSYFPPLYAMFFLTISALIYAFYQSFFIDFVTFFLIF